MRGRGGLKQGVGVYVKVLLHASAVVAQDFAFLTQVLRVLLTLV
jgi:hypothetical protein